METTASPFPETKRTHAAQVVRRFFDTLSRGLTCLLPPCREAQEKEAERRVTSTSRPEFRTTTLRALGL